MKHHDNLQYTRYLDSVFCSTVPLHITCHAEVTQRRLCVRLSHTTDKICVRHVAQIPNEYSQWHARKDSDFPHCCLCRFMCRVHTLTAISTFSLWIHHNSQTTSIAPGNCRRQELIRGSVDGWTSFMMSTWTHLLQLHCMTCVKWQHNKYCYYYYYYASAPVGEGTLKWGAVSVRLSVACRVPRPNLRTERSMKPKIGRM